MPKHSIPYRDTGYFSSLILDYLSQDETVDSLYHRFPSLDAFEKQIHEKAENYTIETRKILSTVLNRQYKDLPTSEATSKHLKNLESENTFTVTTGHQLNLFTGPLYFLYKIISTIKLCNELQNAYPENNFVPVYWMATEDHDFEEINFFNFKENKIEWDKKAEGAVGELTTESLKKVFESFEKKLGPSPNAEKIKTLFKEAYLNHTNLAAATRFLANALFGEYGLLIIDANNKDLKQLFIPHSEEELFNKTASISIEQTNEKINSFSEKNYKIQVNPRAINLFYLKPNLRERIIEKEGIFYINNTTIKFTKTELQAELHKYPERFSPNVLLRPLYQETILPNLCYIGGGGELAYWLQLKEYFNQVNKPFPILLLRNSAMIATTKQLEKIKKLNVSINDLFLDKHKLETKLTKQISNLEIDFSPLQHQLKKQFKELYSLAQKTDPTFKKMVDAQQVKQLKGIETLEKRMLKAQKRKLKDHLDRVTQLQNELFPNGSLQERFSNFSELYLEYGESLIPTIFKELYPLDSEFQIIKM